MSEKLGAEDLRGNKARSASTPDKTIEEIVEEVQQVADQCQQPAWRYEEAEDGSILEIRCFPKPRVELTERGRLPVPDDDNDGCLAVDPDGKLVRSWAVPVRLSDDLEPEEDYVLDLVAGETRPVDDPDSSGDAVDVPPERIVKWASAKRRNSLRTTLVNPGTDKELAVKMGPDAREVLAPQDEANPEVRYYPVELRWVEVNLPYEPGADPELTVHEEI